MLTSIRRLSVILILGLGLTPIPEVQVFCGMVTGSCPDCYAPMDLRSHSKAGKDDARILSLEEIEKQSADVHGLQSVSYPSLHNSHSRKKDVIRKQPTNSIESVRLVRDCLGSWQWQADGEPISMRQGANYQPTEGDLHINDYIENHHLDQLAAQLLPDNEAKKIDPAFIGRNHGAKLREDGFTAIRLFQVPLDDATEIARFKQVMRRAYALYGIRVNVGDFLGLYDPSVRDNGGLMRERVLKLGTLYGSESWVANFTLGNESDLFLPDAPLAIPEVHLNATPADYYATMDWLAGVLKSEVGVKRPVFLGHGLPNSNAVNFLSGLHNFDGVGFNLYGDAGELTKDLAILQRINDLRQANHLDELPFLLNEFGQNTDWLSTLDDAHRAEVFASQIETLDSSPLIAGRYVFEFANEGWKAREEGPFADHYGINGQPAVEQTFSDYRETPPAVCPSASSARRKA